MLRPFLFSPLAALAVLGATAVVDAGEMVYRAECDPENCDPTKCDESCPGRVATPGGRGYVFTLGGKQVPTDILIGLASVEIRIDVDEPNSTRLHPTLTGWYPPTNIADRFNNYASWIDCYPEVDPPPGGCSISITGLSIDPNGRFITASQVSGTAPPAIETEFEVVRVVVQQLDGAAHLTAAWTPDHVATISGTAQFTSSGSQAFSFDVYRVVNGGGAPLSGGFTYQGLLKSGGVPVSSPVNVSFDLYKSASGGAQDLVAPDPLGSRSITPQQGYFTAQLDFGAIAFNGERRWLEVTVGGTPLAPRQEITSAPISSYATNAKLVDGLPGAALVTLGGDQTLSGAKTFTAAPTFAAAGAPFSVTSTTTVPNLSADRLGGQPSSAFGRLAAGQTQVWSGANTFSNNNNAFSGTGTGLTALDANNLTLGTLPSDRLSGTYSLNVSFTSSGNSFTGSGAALINLNASNVTSGTLPGGQLGGTYTNAVVFSNPVNSFTGTHAGSGAALTTLNAGNITSGTLPDGRLGGTYSDPVIFDDPLNNFTGTHAGSGAALTGLNASNIASGTLDVARIADLSLGGAKLATGAVTNAKLGSSSVTTDKISGPGAGAGQALVYDGASVAWTPVATSVESLRLIRGHVDPNGAPVPGSNAGFTSVKQAMPAGTYRVSYATPFPSEPAVTVTPIHSNAARTATVSISNNGMFEVRIYDAAGASVNGEFYFTAVGPR